MDIENTYIFSVGVISNLNYVADLFFIKYFLKDKGPV